MFSICLRHDDHTRQYSIAPLDGFGWEVKLQEDRQLTRVTRYDDWHRVERALALFRREVQELTARGWREIPS